MVPGLAPEPPGPAHIFFSFQGRIPRRTWWLYGLLAPLGLGILFTALLRIAGVSPGIAEGVSNLLLLWPLLAVSAKRWHDIGRSGWWALAVLPPVVGWIVALVFNGLVAGTPGPNRYGDPAPALQE